MSKYTINDSSEIKNEYLIKKLAILGFEHVKSLNDDLDSSIGYHVLGRVGNALENYQNPSKLIIQDKKNADEVIDAMVQEIKDDQNFMKYQDELIFRIRSIYPEFALNMHKKVSAEDWELYSRVVKQTGCLIRDLTIGSKKRNLTKCSELEEQDAISTVIDSHEFAKACKIEDDFMMQEFQEFKKAAKEFGYEDETIKDTSVGIALAELVRESDSLSYKKKNYSSKVDKYIKFVESLNDTVFIRSKDKYRKEKDREHE